MITPSFIDALIAIHGRKTAMVVLGEVIYDDVSRVDGS